MQTLNCTVMQRCVEEGFLIFITAGVASISLIIIIVFISSYISADLNHRMRQRGAVNSHKPEPASFFPWRLKDGECEEHRQWG